MKAKLEDKNHNQYQTNFIIAVVKRSEQKSFLSVFKVDAECAFEGVLTKPVLDRFHD